MFVLNTNKLFFISVLIVTIIGSIYCECRQSYVTICDNIRDIKNISTVKQKWAKWTELIVGNENVDESTLTTYNLHSIIPFRRLISLTIIGQLNRISPLLGRCSFEYDLETLIFYKNNIKTLERTSIPGLKLKKLSLVNNQIEQIESLFASGAHIETVDLSDNKIEAIEDFVFASVTKALIIRNNRISYIQENSLPKSLQILNLDGNKLRTIQDVILQNLPDLQKLSLSHNNLYLLPNISESTKLKSLDLSYNSISTINEKMFRNLTQLHFIDLSHNKIESASLADFSLRINKQEGLLLSLGFNKLRKFNVTGNYEYTLEIFLYGNPFDCTEFDEIQKSMQALRIGQNFCDRKHQSEGKSPYCLDYNSIFHRNVSKTVEDFLTLIEKNGKLISCDIDPLTSVGYKGVNCVA